MPRRLSPAQPAHGLTPSFQQARARSFRAKRALALVPLLVVMPFLALGCASLESLFGPDKTDPPILDSAARQDRITRLETSIEEDHDTLEALVTGQRADSDGPLHKNKDLRAIAERLSQNEEELEALLRAQSAEDAKDAKDAERVGRVEQSGKAAR